MSPRYLLTAFALVALITPSVAAGQARNDQVDESGTQSAPPERQAVPRQSAPAPAPPPAAPRAEATRSEPREQPQQQQRQAVPRGTPVRQAEPARQPEPQRQAVDSQGTAVPRGSRPQGDNPEVGRAIPRTSRPAPPAVAGNGGGVIIRNAPIYSRYYYPQRYYPYGYGAFGLGYFYYDPYSWYPGGYPGYGYYPPYIGGGQSTFDTGELRLRVTPRDAQVFIDGYYAGVVDDFDGAFQSLRLESGPYKIELVMPGYETLEFNVRITRGRTLTYRGELVRLRP